MTAFTINKKIVLGLCAAHSNIDIINSNIYIDVNREYIDIGAITEGLTIRYRIDSIIDNFREKGVYLIPTKQIAWVIHIEEDELLRVLIENIYEKYALFEFNCGNKIDFWYPYIHKALPEVKKKENLPALLRLRKAIHTIYGKDSEKYYSITDSGIVFSDNRLTASFTG